MSGTIGRKRLAPPPRKPSPPRENAPEEITFRQKLDEIKRMRSSGGVPDTTASSSQAPQQLLQRECNEEPIVPKQVKTLSGIKTFLKSFGPWVEVVSKSGKVYYYNKKTQTNQWKKPDEWLEEEKRLNPPIPTEAQPEKPPEPPQPLDPSLPPQKLKVKMKLKTKKRVITKRPKKVESKLPLAYQKNPVTKLLETSDEEAEESRGKLTIENAFEDPEEDQDKNKLARLDKQDEIGHLDIKLPPEPKAETSQPGEAAAGEADKKAASAEDKVVKKFSSSASGMDRASNLAKGSAPEMAFQNINKVPETTAIYGEQANNLNNTETGNSTYFSEYNLPCCLKRCKFPKEQDVIHELKINKLKKRNFYPSASIPGLDPKLAYLAEEAEMEQFYIELKNYNTHDRLLTTRMGGTLVYKVPDEVWDRYVHKFQIKIFNGVYLECKPSGYSHNDELIYSRTGKACGYKTFPEDEVRCQAVLQAWNKEYCLCVYANKIFKVKRDDDAWEDVLREVRRFLEKNGF